MNELNGGLSDAKQTLLNALESIEEVEGEIGAEVAHLAVVYSVYREDEEHQIHEQGGWNHSPDPDWLIAALLRRAAKAIEGPAEKQEDEEERE